jgi:16S rRNA G966 N2-methylase RsmD
VVASDVLNALERFVNEPTVKNSRIDVLFLDPPYSETEQYKNVLSYLGDANLLTENAVVIAEHQRSLDLPETFGKLERVRVLRQGDAALTFYRFRPPSLPERPRSE